MCPFRPGLAVVQNGHISLLSGWNEKIIEPHIARTMNLETTNQSFGSTCLNANVTFLQCTTLISGAIGADATLQHSRLMWSEVSSC